MALKLNPMHLPFIYIYNMCDQAHFAAQHVMKHNAENPGLYFPVLMILILDNSESETVSSIRSKPADNRLPIQELKKANKPARNL